MKKYILAVFAAVLAMSMTVVSCSDKKDNKGAIEKIMLPERNTESADNYGSDDDAAAEEVTMDMVFAIQEQLNDAARNAADDDELRNVVSTYMMLINEVDEQFPEDQITEDEMTTYINNCEQFGQIVGEKSPTVAAELLSALGEME